MRIPNKQAKSHAESDLSQVKALSGEDLMRAKTALVDASALAFGVLQKLDEAQSSHAVQIASLQFDLAAAVRKCHELELQLARAAVFLESKEAQPLAAEMHKARNSNET